MPHPFSSQGQLRTREVLDRLKSVPAQPGQKPPLLIYLGVLLQKGKLNAMESAELARCVRDVKGLRRGREGRAL